MTKHPKEAKYNDIVGWCPETTTTNLLKMMQHDKKGNWRRDRVIRVLYVTCSITWTTCKDKPPHIITSPVPVGMKNLMVKNQSASGQSWESFPRSVKKHFELQVKPAAFNANDYNVEVSFSTEEKYGKFTHLYCRFCEKKKFAEIWKKHRNFQKSKLCRNGTILENHGY